MDKWLSTRPKSQPGLAIKMALAEKTRRAGYADAVLELWARVQETGWLTDRSIWLATVTLRSIDRRE